MHQPRRLRLIPSILLCFVLQALGADKYTDENRPYEFGFKIDGEQHRHESKDKDGIIMGEFGFVTADDVYHVTVYATDKEGRFKILSMKNIHLKSTARQGHALALPPAQPVSVQASAVPQQLPKQGGLSTPAQLGPFTPLAAQVSQGPIAPQPKTPNKPVSIEPPGRSCSSCSLPTTTTRAPPPALNQGAGNNNYNSPNQFGPPSPPSQNQQAFPPIPAGQQNIAQRRQQPFPPSYPAQKNIVQSGPKIQNIPQQGLIAPNSASSFAAQPGPTVQIYPSQPINLQSPVAFPPSSPDQQYIAQGGPKSQNIPQQGFVAPNSASSFAAVPGPTAQIYPSQPIYSQSPFAFPPSSPDQQYIAQGGPKSQNIPQQGFASPNSASSFAAQPGPTAQIYPNPPTYSQGPVSSYVPNNYKESRGPSDSVGPTQGGAEFGPNAQPNEPSLTNPQGPRERTAKQYNGPAKPTLVSAQMQIVDKNTNIHALGPNEQKGLPPGLKEGDMTQLLYTFNYTLGFHGHFEEGYKNGVKKGYYFVTGRNGVRTRVDYVADDAGFHPKVSQDVLDLLSEDVPKPETEKDEKYGLKGYEFKWLYYPVESKRR